MRTAHRDLDLTATCTVQPVMIDHTGNGEIAAHDLTERDQLRWARLRRPDIEGVSTARSVARRHDEFVRAGPMDLDDIGAAVEVAGLRDEPPAARVIAVVRERTIDPRGV